MAGPGSVPEEGTFVQPGPAFFVPANYFQVRLDARSLPAKKELLTGLASALKFPSYFGYNWDALLDCLRSMPEFNPAPGYALWLENSAVLLKDNPGDLADFRELAEDADAFLREKYKIKFIVVLG